MRLLTWSRTEDMACTTLLCLMASWLPDSTERRYLICATCKQRTNARNQSERMGRSQLRAQEDQRVESRITRRCRNSNEEHAYQCGRGGGRRARSGGSAVQRHRRRRRGLQSAHETEGNTQDQPSKHTRRQRAHEDGSSGATRHGGDAAVPASKLAIRQ